MSLEDDDVGKGFYRMILLMPAMHDTEIPDYSFKLVQSEL